MPQELWRAVIEQALWDASWIGRHAERDRKAARQFLLEDTTDFFYVCENADADAVSIRKYANDMALKGWLELPPMHQLLRYYK